MEVTLAIGVVAFAFIGVFGLIPTGLNTFHQAIDTSVGSQIAQRIITEIQQTDFNVLTQASTGVANDTYRYTWTLSNGQKSQIRYFDDQGTEVVPVNPASLSPVESQRILYWVNTRVMPATKVPSSSANPPDDATDQHLATVSIQIANNPGNQQLAVSSADSSDAGSPLRNLWTGGLQNNPASTWFMPITTYSTFVSRNQ